MKLHNHFFKYIIGLVFVMFFRLIPHPPNIEPIMTTMMPYAKRWGVLAGIIFTFLAMFLFDLVTGTLGMWSFLTISTYCLIAFFAGYFFKKRNKTIHYVSFAVIGTLLYDAITGLAVGMLVFNQSFAQTLIFQIPFTINHLLSNVIFAIFISPVIYKWILENPKFESSKVLNYFKNLVPS